jgi:hypothetical protein
MDSMHHQQVERETHRAQASRDELVELIRQALREDGTVEPLKGLHLHRSSSPNIAFIKYRLAKLGRTNHKAGFGGKTIPYRNAQATKVED